MTDDDKKLVERLRQDTNETDTWGRKKNWTEQRSERRKAADRIEALSAENERLRDILEQWLETAREHLDTEVAGRTFEALERAR